MSNLLLQISIAEIGVILPARFLNYDWYSLLKLYKARSSTFTTRGLKIAIEQDDFPLFTASFESRAQPRSLDAANADFSWSFSLS